MYVIKLITSFGIFILLLSTSLLGQKPYTSEVSINSFLEKYPLINKESAINFYSVAGLKEAKMYDIGVSSLADFNTRKDCYISILREIALQNDFDVTNLLQVYNCKNSTSVGATIDFYKEIGKWSGISVQFFKALSEKTDFITNTDGNELSGIKKVITSVSKSDLKNLSTLINVYSVVANGADFINKDTYLAHYNLLLKAAQFDIGLQRMKDLKALNMINDQAFASALDDIITEMQNFPLDYWSRYYYAIKMNPNEAKGGFSSFTKMGLNVASLMSSTPILGWAKAVVSVAETIDMINDWNEKWREVTLAGTIYYNLSKTHLNNNVNLVDISDFIQFLFLKKFNFCMENKYLKVWECVREDQKQVRLYIEKEKTGIETSIIDKRVGYWMETQGNPVTSSTNVKNRIEDRIKQIIYEELGEYPASYEYHDLNEDGIDEIFTLTNTSINHSVAIWAINPLRKLFSDNSTHSFVINPEKKDGWHNITFYTYIGYANSPTGLDHGSVYSWNDIQKGYEILNKGSVVDNMHNSTFRDNRDGKVYKTVQIGNQVWMAENLAYKLNSGCWAYDNNLANVKTYGYLYNWETAKNVCPAGWHLPTDAEWTSLVDYLGGKSVAGGKMKEKGTSHWHSPNISATNESGFHVLPAGTYWHIDYSFSDIEYGATFWSVTKVSRVTVNIVNLSNEKSTLEIYDCNENMGFSVRCIMN